MWRWNIHNPIHFTHGTCTQSAIKWHEWTYVGIPEKTYTVEKRANSRNYRSKFGCLCKQKNGNASSTGQSLSAFVNKKMAIGRLQVKRWPVISTTNAFFDSVCFLSNSHICCPIQMAWRIWYAVFRGSRDIKKQCRHDQTTHTTETDT